MFENTFYVYFDRFYRIFGFNIIQEDSNSKLNVYGNNEYSEDLCKLNNIKKHYEINSNSYYLCKMNILIKYLKIFPKDDNCKFNNITILIVKPFQNKGKM